MPCSWQFMAQEGGECSLFIVAQVARAVEAIPLFAQEGRTKRIPSVARCDFYSMLYRRLPGRIPILYAIPLITKHKHAGKLNQTPSSRIQPPRLHRLIPRLLQKRHQRRPPVPVSSLPSLLADDVAKFCLPPFPLFPSQPHLPTLLLVVTAG